MEPTPGSLLEYLMDANCGPTSHSCGKICIPVHKKCSKKGALGEVERGKKARDYAKHLKAGGKDDRKGFRPSAEELEKIGQDLQPKNAIAAGLKRISPEAKGLATEAQRTIGQLEELGKEASSVGKMSEAFNDLKKSIKETNEFLESINPYKGETIDQQAARMAREARDKERESRGIVGRDLAKHVARSKQTFELLNPGKLIKVPKGTTQRQYFDILVALNKGDKDALKQYTTPKPKGYKTVSDRRRERMLEELRANGKTKKAKSKTKKRNDATPGSLLEYLMDSQECGRSHIPDGYQCKVGSSPEVQEHVKRVIRSLEDWKRSSDENEPDLPKDAKEWKREGRYQLGLDLEEAVNNFKKTKDPKSKKRAGDILRARRVLQQMSDEDFEKQMVRAKKRRKSEEAKRGALSYLNNRLSSVRRGQKTLSEWGVEIPQESHSEYENLKARRQRLLHKKTREDAKLTKAEKKRDKVFKEWKSGELNIGKSDKKVPYPSGRAQAIAIALSEQERAK